MKRRRPFGGGLVASLVLLALAWPVAEAAGEELVTARPAIREVLLSGFTRSRASLALVTEVAGRVLEVTADVGDVVGGDGIFARLDHTFLDLDLEGNQVEQERLRSRIDYAAKEAERQRALVERGDTSQAALDDAEQAVRDDRFALRGLEVEERVLEERLRRSRVTAPPGWRISRRLVEPGQWVSTGDVVGEALDLSQLVVPYALTAEQLTRLRAAREGLRLELPELGITVDAEIYRVNPAFDPETRKLPVELAITLPAELARGGWRVELALPMPEGAGTVVVPRRALAGSYEERWLVREDGERVTVTVLGGLEGGPGTVKVNAPGLRAGDRFRIPQEERG